MESSTKIKSLIKQVIHPPPPPPRFFRAFEDHCRTKTQKLFRSQKGFSLVGLLVTSVIGLILMAGMGDLMVSVIRSNKRTENLVFTTNILDRFMAFMQEKEICSGTLKGKDAGSTHNLVTDIQRETGTPPSISSLGLWPLEAGSVQLDRVTIQSMDSVSKTVVLTLQFSSSQGELLRDSHEVIIS